MTMLRSSTADVFTPQDYGALVNLAVQAQSVAARTATVVQTDKEKIGFKIWVSDPAVAHYNENDTIAETDGDTDEVICIPSKTAGITSVSNELVDDSDPAMDELIGKGLANQIARAMDGAYLAQTTAKGPDGLLSVAYTSVDVPGGTLVNLDPFYEARFDAEAAGSQLTSWIVSHETAKALTLLKKQTTGSNESLTDFVEDGLTIAGLPVVRSNQVDADTLFWGIPKDHVMMVLRKDTRVERFPNVHQDGVWLRAVARYGYAFLNEPGVVRDHNVTP
ncbi:phage major capsid protein [Mycolicibacterium goodii]|uniref:phage major capsid protein n=1 Tax=Mycolicibacterium goodii TaxID=134601 RepID=UPI001BDDAA4F|nr:phage major capsid protein [Mycolicibacterium goodii]MBU8808070.1 phage major capsid protein [Mycolicibacterium goodii]